MNLPNSEYLQIFLGIVSAIILFLFAIEGLGKEFQMLASEEFRKKISSLVKNRFTGALVGAISTALVQSSSAITAVAIVLVNTGIISFRNSLGVIFGSSIGTTVTAQLALLSSTPIAPILIIVGFLMKFVSKKSKVASNSVFFLGFILFSLSILSQTVRVFSSTVDFEYFFSYISNPIIAYTVACLLTVIVHSSSIISGILVVLASTGVMSVDIAIPMILGANLGTAVSTLLVSSNLNLFAKRAGYANVLFKVIGSLLFMLFVKEFIHLLGVLSTDAGQQVALGHLIFNVVNTVVFLLILDPFEKLIIKIVPGNEQEVLFETKFIKDTATKRLSDSILDIKKELGYSIENTVKIYQKSISLFFSPSGRILLDIQKLETLNDYLDDEITKALLSLSRYQLSKAMASEVVMLVKISNTIEQLGDLGIDFSEVFKRMHQLGIPLEEVHIEKLMISYNKLEILFKSIDLAIQSTSERELKKIKQQEEEIYALIRDEFDSHVKRLQEDTAYHGNIFVDAVSVIELSVSKLRDIRKLLLKQERSGIRK